MGAIQSSFNALFASMLGAGFAVSQSPGAKEIRERGNITRSLGGKEAFLQTALDLEEKDKASTGKALEAFKKDETPENYEMLKAASEEARGSKDLGPSAYEDISKSQLRLAELTHDPEKRALYYRQGMTNAHQAEQMREDTKSFYKDQVRSVMHRYEGKRQLQNSVEERLKIIKNLPSEMTSEELKEAVSKGDIDWNEVRFR